MKESHDRLHALDVRTLCREGDRLQGEWPLARMPRLGSSLEGAPPAGAAVAWSAQGESRPVTGGEPQLWLHLVAHAEVQLQCQRCLQPLRHALAVDRRFLFVRSEADAERLDEELEDDVMVLPVRLDLPEVLEDELILALPLVPRHEGACPQPLPLLVPDAVPEEERANPFAALAALRRRDDSSG